MPDLAVDISNLDGAWTEARVELLKALWLEGLSASQIAGILGGGVSRSAVIGKVHRLKLTGRSPAMARPKGAAAVAGAMSAERITGKGRQAGRATVRPKPGGRAGEIAQARAERNNRMATGGVTRAERLDTMAAAADAPVPAVRTSPEAAAYDATARGITLLQLSEDTCKWPIGDPLEPDFAFCGHASLEGKPYCDHHDKRATVNLKVAA